MHFQRIADWGALWLTQGVHPSALATNGSTGRAKSSGYFWDSVALTAGTGVHFAKMTLRSRLWAVTALLALLGTPGLSCFVPRQLLGAGEQECCRQMGSQCGSKDMSSPQSCCKSPIQQSAQPYLSSSVEHFQISPPTAVAAFSPVERTPPLFVADSALTVVEFHSPPLSLPETNSVLRI
jgi:hypothetical protein